MPGLRHLWQGEWLSDEAVNRQIDRLADTVQNVVGEPLRTDAVLSACHRLSREMTDSSHGDFRSLSRDALERRLRRELGTTEPRKLTRLDFRTTVFGGRAPVGLVVHLPPTCFLAVFSAIEGVLVGNFNVVFADGEAAPVMGKLLGLDPTGQIAARVAVLQESPDHYRWLRAASASADAAAIWADADTLFPATCRQVRREAGVRIAYLSRDAFEDEDMPAALAAIMSGINPIQMVYLDTNIAADVMDFRMRLRAVAGVAYEPDVECQPRNSLAKALWPMRARLHTAVIAGNRCDVAELSRLALLAGARRAITLRATSSEHDSEIAGDCFALQQYSRPIFVQADDRFTHDASLDELVDIDAAALLAGRDSGVEGFGRSSATAVPPAVPVLTKAQAQHRIARVAPEFAELYFASGGTTGAPAVSVYTYRDYGANMRATAEGLLAAGLEPSRDRTANLFYADLGGGYVSFFEVLEYLTATQVPVGARPDLEAVIAAITNYRIDTLLGMPSYLWRLCRREEAALRVYGGIRKMFFAGEYFSPQQRRWLAEQLGIEIVKPAAYTTTDLGPLGYQCAELGGTAYHLQHDLHSLEILDLDFDRPADSGRLVFTRNIRRGQHLERYEIGDVGRWIPGSCGCGRQSPRFELLGRRGDLIRIAGRFIDYRQLVQVAEVQLGYAGNAQVVLDHHGERERLTLRLDRRSLSDVGAARRSILSGYSDLRKVVENQELLDFVIEAIDQISFERTSNSGKIQAVIDLRTRS